MLFKVLGALLVLSFSDAQSIVPKLPAESVNSSRISLMCRSLHAQDDHDHDECERKKREGLPTFKVCPPSYKPNFLFIYLVLAMLAGFLLVGCCGLFMQRGPNRNSKIAADRLKLLLLTKNAYRESTKPQRLSESQARADLMSRHAVSQAAQASISGPQSLLASKEMLKEAVSHAEALVSGIRARRSVQKNHSQYCRNKCFNHCYGPLIVRGLRPYSNLRVDDALPNSAKKSKFMTVSRLVERLTKDLILCFFIMISV